jgi:hypothetical protein
LGNKPDTAADATMDKSLLVLFFRKEQESSFSEEKEAKRLFTMAAWLALPALGQGP